MDGDSLGLQCPACGSQDSICLGTLGARVGGSVAGIAALTSTCPRGNQRSANAQTVGSGSQIPRRPFVPSATSIVRPSDKGMTGVP